MDIEEVWSRLLEKLKSYPSIDPKQIDAFFSRIQIQAVSSGFAMFTASNAFIRDWVDEHFRKDIETALHDLYGMDFFVQIEVDSSQTYIPVESTSSQAAPINHSGDVRRAPLAPQPADEPAEKSAPTLTATPSTPSSDGGPKDADDALLAYQKSLLAARPERQGSDHGQHGRLQHKPADEPQPETKPDFPQGPPSLTFDTFVMGDSNRMAYSMAIEVAERPGGDSHMNPLFIYGKSGVGKTHLMCAMQNYINEQYPDYAVCYIDSTDFVNRYSAAAMEKSTNKQSFNNFEAYFEQADVLLIDDIQSLQGKPGTLGAVFRIFNSMVNRGKQIVLSADRSPHNIDLDERYISRFNSGATIDVQPPDDVTKRGIIKSFLEQCQREEHAEFVIDDDAMDYLVEHSSSNVRELKSAITKLVFALKRSPGEPMTRTWAQELLADHFMSEAGNRLTKESIQQAVERFYGVSHADLMSKKRTRDVAHARHVTIYLTRELLGCTFKEIGKIFDRDHSSIMYSDQLISGKLKEDRGLREEVEAIRQLLRTQQF